MDFELMKKLFNEKKKLVVKTNKVGHQLDSLIYEEWGFSFSDTDDDPIIDTLDYGTNNISFEQFKERMYKYKKNAEENNGDYGCVID